MGFMDELKRLAHPYEDEDYPEEEEDNTTSLEEERKKRSRISDAEFTSSEPQSYRAPMTDKVVNIHTTTQLKVVLVKPEKFDDASVIADHLRDKRTVVMNLENVNQTNPAVGRRLIDFLSGVAYALEGKIKKIASSTYIITPYNVDLIGDLLDELENSGMHF